MKLKDAFHMDFTIGDPCCVYGLGVVPVLSKAAAELPPPFLLEEGVGKGMVTIHGIGDGGEVPFLVVDNRAVYLISHGVGLSNRLR